MAKRKAISKKTRFEVFKRDSFTCQYCGGSAPQVTLHVDHIEPVSKGGDDSIINLITACEGCNLGKSDRRLSDQSALAKQREQLAALNEKREQLEMMVRWRTALLEMGDQELDLLVLEAEALIGNISINDSGRADLRRLLRKYGYQDSLKAVAQSVDRYVEWVDGEATNRSLNLAFRSFEKVASYAKLPPDTQAAHYVRGILKNRFPDEVYPGSEAWDECLSLMLDGMSEGVFTERALKEEAKAADNFDCWFYEHKTTFDYFVANGTEPERATGL